MSSAHGIPTTVPKVYGATATEIVAARSRPHVERPASSASDHVGEPRTAESPTLNDTRALRSKFYALPVHRRGAPSVQLAD